MNYFLNYSNRISALVIAVVCVMLFCIFAVDISTAEKSKDDSPYFNKELSRLSYGLALLDSNAAYIDQVDCLIVRVMARNSEKSGKEDTGAGRNNDVARIFELRNQEEREWCDIFADVARETKDIAVTSLQTKTVPIDGFLFYATRPEPLYEDESSKELLKNAVKLGKFPPSPYGEPVGLFKTIDHCRSAEARLRKLDNPTRPCRSWMDSWFAKAEAPKPEVIEAAQRADYKKAIWAAVSRLLSFGAMVLVYLFSRHMFSYSSPISSRQRVRDYMKCAGAVAVVSLLLWATYGTHFESEDADPIHGTGEWVQDFKPTDKERNEHGIEMFLLLLVPAWFGVRRAHMDAPLASPGAVLETGR